MRCFFDIQNIYYTLQHQYVWGKLNKRGHDYELIIYQNHTDKERINKALKNQNT